MYASYDVFAANHCTYCNALSLTGLAYAQLPDHNPILRLKNLAGTLSFVHEPTPHYFSYERRPQHQRLTGALTVGPSRVDQFYELIYEIAGYARHLYDLAPGVGGK